MSKFDKHNYRHGKKSKCAFVDSSGSPCGLDKYAPIHRNPLYELDPLDVTVAPPEPKVGESGREQPNCVCGHMYRDHTDVVSINPWNVGCTSCFCREYVPSAHEPKVGESGLGDEQRVKQIYPNALAAPSGVDGGLWVIYDPTQSGQIYGSDYHGEREAWADARARIEAIKEEKICHYHNGPFQPVCPLGGECETREDWMKPKTQSVAPQGGEERLSLEELQQMAYEWCFCPPQSRGTWSCRNCRAIGELIKLRAHSESVAPPSLPMQNYEQNLRYATQIAEYLHKNCFSEVTQWKPISGDLFGVLMQIDNMCTGVQRRAAVPDPAIKEFLSVCEGECDHPYCWSQKGTAVPVAPLSEKEPLYYIQDTRNYVGQFVRLVEHKLDQRLQGQYTEKQILGMLLKLSREILLKYKIEPLDAPPVTAEGKDRG